MAKTRPTADSDNRAASRPEVTIATSSSTPNRTSASAGKPLAPAPAISRLGLLRSIVVHPPVAHVR